MTTEPYDEATSPDVPEVAQAEDPGWPLGFMTVLVLAGLYMVWRLIDLGIRFFRWAF